MKLFRLPGTSLVRNLPAVSSSTRNYAGASFIIRNHSFREAPWEHFDGVVDNLMGTYDIPEPILAAAE